MDYKALPSSCKQFVGLVVNVVVVDAAFDVVVFVFDFFLPFFSHVDMIFVTFAMMIGILTDLIQLHVFYSF